MARCRHAPVLRYRIKFFGWGAGRDKHDPREWCDTPDRFLSRARALLEVDVHDWVLFTALGPRCSRVGLAECATAECWCGVNGGCAHCCPELFGLPRLSRCLAYA